MKLTCEYCRKVKDVPNKRKGQRFCSRACRDARARFGGWQRYEHNGYYMLRRNIEGQPVLMFEHRLVWEMHYGPVPAGYEIHHKNGNGMDNRLDNLEILPIREHRRLHNIKRRRNE